ncbi:ParB/RepB/Spo0J family partition protein [Massilimicrobiota timonensis]|mgnify:FL=1|uniref:ParB/RepB/Spo0J family partition protein n=1 Tax=Massilimicrobiota timonensis TaxID=1776392 RepID=A0ABT7UK93_9FIRM|nr:MULTISPECIES: ParB/RepB/Spo0J family partition protein [Massilimicrobiota]MDM8196558.1 ParB/RepB/Spo0J family partition protein [Massilimicrobiota timonensis]OUQ77538.1 nucleoid occlusion protein [Massilimicrobiota sp. An105]
MKEPKYKFIDIHKIEANGHQPRTHFENEKIQELAVSIQQNGLLQPIVVRPYHGKYQIVVGERRYRACLLAGIEEVPCLVQNYDEQQTATAAIVENIQRENLSAIEEALAYQQILDTQNITQEELAQKVGKKQSTIANKLRLLQLPMTVQEAVRRKDITERHARALLKLDTTAKQNNMLREIMDKGLNVEQTEEKIKKKIEPKKPKPKTKSISQNLKIAMNTLDQAAMMVQQAGVETTVDISETDEEVVYVIKMKK